MRVKMLAVVAGLVTAAGWMAPGAFPAGVRVAATVVFALAAIWSSWPARLRWPLAAVAMALLLSEVTGG